MIDDVDLQILNILQGEARTSNADIARQVGLAPSATHERLKRLQERGVLRGFVASIDPHEVGLGLLAFVSVRTDDSFDPIVTAEALAAIPEVLELHNVAGEDCYVAKVRTADPENLAVLLRERIKKVPGVRGTRTTIVLETHKEQVALPLDRSVRCGGSGHGE